MALSDRVVSITEESYVPASIDAVLNSNVFTARLFMREQKTWTGRQIHIPLQFAAPTSVGGFTGMGDFDTSLQNTRVRQSFTHAQLYSNVSVAGGEVSLNKTDGEVLDLMKITMEESQNALTDELGDQVYAGLDTGENDINGLAKIVDDGTNSSTYAGLSRTTYTMLDSTLTAATAGALTFTDMATSMRAAAAAGSKRQRPSIIITTETVHDLLESLYTPTINSNYDSLSHVQVTAFSKPGVAFKDQESLKGQYGFEALYWRGIPIVADEKCDSGAMFMLNEEYLHWYNLPGVGLSQYKINKKVDSAASEFSQAYPIQWSGFDKPYNQYSDVGQFIMLGNVLSGHTRRHSKYTGITTV